MAKLTQKQIFLFDKYAGPCRACGAVLAPRTQENAFDLCDTCWGSLCAYTGAPYDWDNKVWKKVWDGGKIDETAFLGWLSRKLVKDMQRFRRNGLMGRCEALTHQGNNIGVQCGLVAVRMHDGHKVCSRHAAATINTYVTERTSDYYEVFRDHLTTLSAADQRFAQVIKEVANQ